MDAFVLANLLGSAKSEPYKSRYFYKVSAYRGIELNFKHLLGRPPLNQQKLHMQLQFNQPKASKH